MDINNLVRVNVNQQEFKVPSSITGFITPQYISEWVELTEVFQEEEEKVKLNKHTKPKVEPGEFAVKLKEKLREKRFNPRTKRMKTFKSSRWLVTKIPPEERSFKNLPRYANKKSKVRFQDWLELKTPSEYKNIIGGHSVKKGANGVWYGWSHRAVGSFKIGKIIKPGIIGNKFEYGAEQDKKYNALYDKDPKKADEYHKSLKKFEPYEIKTDKEAMEHALRFAKDVS